MKNNARGTRGACNPKHCFSLFVSHYSLNSRQWKRGIAGSNQLEDIRYMWQDLPYMDCVIAEDICDKPTHLVGSEILFSWMAIVTPTDRPKSVRNRSVIELFYGVVCVVILPF